MKHQAAILSQLPDPDELGTRIVVAWHPLMTPAGAVFEVASWPVDIQPPAVGDQLIVMSRLRIPRLPWMLGISPEDFAKALADQFALDPVESKDPQMYRFEKESLGDTWLEAMQESEKVLMHAADYVFGLTK